MKSTDMARKDRDLRKARKKEEVLARKMEKNEKTVGDYINELNSLFFHDGTKIYNIEMSDEILDLLDEMKEELEEKNWMNVIRKAVKKSGVKEKESAITQLKEMGEIE
ncbi:hypothetical protein EW093_09275 [Thiospirochaeta perfilievii]|uniref:Uncharacterized protein n=1 Tax=Thiospirochaeta perfilievii TaxID=252967 RepID=A0A5C1QC33_9SPIO|nr:hypothetical protein [Thiospirochaeta perfilievii]QEN04888.1 hypothetical protein EW093_09275 [Thiospirochaeta perfilievii]